MMNKRIFLHRWNHLLLFNDFFSFFLSQNSMEMVPFENVHKDQKTSSLLHTITMKIFHRNFFYLNYVCPLKLSECLAKLFQLNHRFLSLWYRCLIWIRLVHWDHHLCSTNGIIIGSTGSDQCLAVSSLVSFTNTSSVHDAHSNWTKTMNMIPPAFPMMTLISIWIWKENQQCHNQNSMDRRIAHRLVHCSNKMDIVKTSTHPNWRDHQSSIKLNHCMEELVQCTASRRQCNEPIWIVRNQSMLRATQP